MNQGGDLFSAAVSDRLARRSPLAERLRPRELDEVLGQDHLLGADRPLRALVDTDRLSSAILWGPPGTGKTTLARLLAAASAKEFEARSAVSATVKDVREVIDGAQRRLGEHGRGTILFLDEVHRFNKAQQDALLPAVETGLLILIGATTENPYFSVNAALMSRSVLFRLVPLDTTALRTLLGRGLAAEGAEADDDAIDHLVDRADGDGRHLLACLEVAVALAVARHPVGQPGRPRVQLSDAERALGTRALRYGTDDHYDVVSACIKSIRGSDPDAALYWLARMLEAGEDPRFVARRLVILASEDIGLADATSLLVADAAARAVEYVGMPEARINLAHAVVHLAAAPKSNRSYVAYGAAVADVHASPGQVPLHLRDAGNPVSRGLAHGKGYRYPHDDPSGWVAQEYRPPEVAANRYYHPSSHGDEAEVARRLVHIPDTGRVVGDEDVGRSAGSTEEHDRE